MDKQWGAPCPSDLTPQTALGGESAPRPPPASSVAMKGSGLCRWDHSPRRRVPDQSICMSVSLCQSTVLALRPPWPPPSAACTCSQHGLHDQRPAEGEWCSRGTRRCSLAAGRSPRSPVPLRWAALPLTKRDLSSLSQLSCISRPPTVEVGPCHLRTAAPSHPAGSEEATSAAGRQQHSMEGTRPLSEPLEQGPASSPCNGQWRKLKKTNI